MGSEKQGTTRKNPKRETESGQDNNSYLEKILKSLSDFVTSGNRTLGDILQHEKQTEEWLRQYHRHLIAEYAKGPQSKVYSLLFVNRKDGRRKMILVFAETFEESLKMCEVGLSQENELMADWQIDGHKFISFLKEQREIVPAVDRIMATNKPIGVFINDLNLIRDRFTDTPQERQLVEKLIEKVGKKYLEK